MNQSGDRTPHRWRHSVSNHAELLIEGRAFEQDAKAISRALEDGWQVSAVVESENNQPVKVEKLQINFVAGRVDPESRALHFYVNLPNELVRDHPGSLHPESVRSF